MSSEHKPLTAAELEDVMRTAWELCPSIARKVEQHIKALESRLTPPTDAAVREAVELLDALTEGCEELVSLDPRKVRTLLSHIRAAFPGVFGEEEGR